MAAEPSSRNGDYVFRGSVGTSVHDTAGVYEFIEATTSNKL